MNERGTLRGALEILRRLADRLEGHLEGDPDAFEALGEMLDEDDFSAAEIEAALALLRSIHQSVGVQASAAESPGRGAQRILSSEEREWVSPETWTYLMQLRRVGALTAEQFEQVLGRLSDCAERPATVDIAARIAAGVAMRSEEMPGPEETRRDDVAH